MKKDAQVEPRVQAADLAARVDVDVLGGFEFLFPDHVFASEGGHFRDLKDVISYASAWDLDY